MKGKTMPKLNGQKASKVQPTSSHLDHQSRLLHHRSFRVGGNEHHIYDRLSLARVGGDEHHKDFCHRTYSLPCLFTPFVITEILFVHNNSLFASQLKYIKSHISCHQRNHATRIDYFDFSNYVLSNYKRLSDFMTCY